MQLSIRNFVLNHSTGNDASHDISHIDRVVRNAKQIWTQSDEATRASVSLDILEAMATLHDSFDHKYFTSQEAIEQAKDKVSVFLRNIFNKEQVEMIIRVIDNIGYTTELAGQASLSPSEIQYLYMVQDADRLDAMGAVGIARCFAWAGAFGKSLTDGISENELRNQFARNELNASIANENDSAISIFYRKLLFLKKMLKTPVGVKLGEKRHTFMLQYLDEFFNEQ